MQFGKGLLDPSILQTVEADHHDPRRWTQPAGLVRRRLPPNHVQQGIQCRQLIIHRNPQGHERPRRRVEPTGSSPRSVRVLHELRKQRRCSDRPNSAGVCKFSGDLSGKRILAVLENQIRQLTLGQNRQQLRRRPAL